MEYEVGDEVIWTGDDGREIPAKVVEVRPANSFGFFFRDEPAYEVHGTGKVPLVSVCSERCLKRK